MSRRGRRSTEAKPDPAHAHLSVAKIGLIGSIVVALATLMAAAINAYFGAQATLVPLDATRTAVVEIRLTEAVMPTSTLNGPTSTVSVPATPTSMTTTEAVLASESATITPVVDPTMPPSSPVPTPHLVRLIDSLPPDGAANVRATAASLIQVAQLLPLLIKDGFDSNDYRWGTGQYEGPSGITCDIELRDSKYTFVVKSTPTSGPGTCWARVPRQVGDYYLSFDTSLLRSANSYVILRYRSQDFSNGYFLYLDPGLQRILLGSSQDSADHIWANEFIPVINKSGENKLAVLDMEPTLFLYINDSLVASVQHGEGGTEGWLFIGVRVNEADAVQELNIDNFELRSP
jgi:hypothetical protein